MAEMDWHVAADYVVRILAAYGLALPIGFNREREAHAVGIRTFPIVAMASCGFVLLGEVMPGHTADVKSRIIQGLVAGIGFIGGGAILKDPAGSVHGTATAASVWNTGAIGAAVAMGRYEIAIPLSILNWITLALLLRVKARLDARNEKE